MRSSFAMAFALALAATPAMAQLVIETPNGDASRHAAQAQQDRSDAHMERLEAQQRAAVGDYRGAAQADAAARQDWHAANRQDRRAQQDTGVGIVIGR